MIYTFQCEVAFLQHALDLRPGISPLVMDLLPAQIAAVLLSEEQIHQMLGKAAAAVIAILPGAVAVSILIDAALPCHPAEQFFHTNCL